MFCIRKFCSIQVCTEVIERMQLHNWQCILHCTVICISSSYSYIWYLLYYAFVPSAISHVHTIQIASQGVRFAGRNLQLRRAHHIQLAMYSQLNICCQSTGSTGAYYYVNFSRKTFAVQLKIVKSIKVLSSKTCSGPGLKYQ